MSSSTQSSTGIPTNTNSNTQRAPAHPVHTSNAPFAEDSDSPVEDYEDYAAAHEQVMDQINEDVVRQNGAFQSQIVVDNAQEYSAVQSVNEAVQNGDDVNDLGLVSNADTDANMSGGHLIYGRMFMTPGFIQTRYGDGKQQANTGYTYPFTSHSNHATSEISQNVDNFSNGNHTSANNGADIEDIEMGSTRQDVSSVTGGYLDNSLQHSGGDNKEIFAAECDTTHISTTTDLNNDHGNAGTPYDEATAIAARAAVEGVKNASNAEQFVPEDREREESPGLFMTDIEEDDDEVADTSEDNQLTRPPSSRDNQRQQHRIQMANSAYPRQLPPLPPASTSPNFQNENENENQDQSFIEASYNQLLQNNIQQNHNNQEDLAVLARQGRITHGRLPASNGNYEFLNLTTEDLGTTTVEEGRTGGTKRGRKTKVVEEKAAKRPKRKRYDDDDDDTEGEPDLLPGDMRPEDYPASLLPPTATTRGTGTTRTSNNGEQSSNTRSSTRKTSTKVKKGKKTKEHQTLEVINWHSEGNTQPSELLRELRRICNQLDDHMRDSVSLPDSNRIMTDDQIRTTLHDLPFKSPLSEQLLNQSNLITPGHGLAAIASSISMFPSDIRDFARELLNRFAAGRFSTNLWYGLNYNQTTTKIGQDKRRKVSWGVNTGLYNHIKIRPDVRGDNGLINGQWWPSTMAAMRDGAHGACMKGIHGDINSGAFSIVVSGADYYSGDADNGDTIEYCGQKNKANGDEADGTKQLLKASENNAVIRVLRGNGLPKSNTYRPAEGYRYDGLYRITQVIRKPEGNVSHHFILQRIPGQEPIRHGTLPGSRPTTVEIEHFLCYRKQQQTAARGSPPPPSGEATTRTDQDMGGEGDENQVKEEEAEKDDVEEDEHDDADADNDTAE